ncbi:phosphoglycerate kinase [Candidatus Fermentibacterales bacterium]|nr:phosphoglycerate kinase [Candidatus Fermentibacterales bacterium]
MSWRRLDEADPSGRRVFLRADLNVPLESGDVADDTRIRGVLPTIRRLLDSGASLVIASHLGRPDGRVVEGLSLAPVARRLSGLLELPVAVAPDCVGKRVSMMAASLTPGKILLLENLRFHEEEEKNDPDFAASLAGLADIYVNDAFGTCHRDHASMTGIPRVLGGGYAGLLLQRELETFERIAGNPDKPFTLLLGGAKVADKVLVVENLIEVADNILIGGGMAFTFLAALGHGVGRSVLEPDRVDLARNVIDRAGQSGVRLLLPLDVVVADSKERPETARTVSADSIPGDTCGLDIGPASVAAFSSVLLEESRTIVWNGPMGLFEVPPFDRGTVEMARALACATRERGATTIVGGGDSVRAVSEAGVEDQLSFISTGGGASLKLLQGKQLVAVRALSGE